MLGQCNESVKHTRTRRIRVIRGPPAGQQLTAWTLSQRTSDDGCLTPSDAIQAHSHSFAGRIFASSLKYTLPFAFGPSSYIAWCLFFLGLPPTSTLFNHEVQAGFDYPVQRCLSKHGLHTVPFLDAAGDHASSQCPSTYNSRSKKTHLSFTCCCSGCNGSRSKCGTCHL